MNYLEFVEEHTEKKTLNVFEKIMVSVSRAKGLSEDRQTKVPSPGRHKPISLALYEVNQNLIQPVITNKTSAMPILDDLELDEEEENLG